jgi:large subunit ribosomal protein L46
MLSRSPIRSFFAQHNIPVVPQGAISPPFTPAYTKRLLVGYLLCRQPSVQHSLHPLEQELGFVLDREYARYPRHPAADTATHFFKERGIAIDSWNRQDASAVQRDFFNLESSRDATRQTLERYEPAKRVVAADFFDPTALTADAPPPRHTVQRRLDDFLYLIVKNGPEKGGKWTVPSAERDAKHSLRTAAEINILSDHNKGVDAYLFSNAPQGVLQWKESSSTSSSLEPLPAGANRDEATAQQLFVFCASYISGRPVFANVADHAWVTRHELADYEFDHPDMFSLLRDITTDSKLRN